MYKSSLVAAGLLALASAQNNTPNLTALLGSSNSLSGLVNLIGAYPNIGQALTSLDNVTIFAPNNAAIAALQASGALDNANEALIQTVLNYHIVPGVVYSSAISETPTFAHTLLNDTMYSNVTDGQVVEVALDGSDVVLTSGLKLTSTVVDAVSTILFHINDRIQALTFWQGSELHWRCCSRY